MCLPYPTPRWTRWQTKQKDKRRKERKTKRQEDRKIETDTMVKQCKMLTSLNLRWTRWQRESSLCFQHHEPWEFYSQESEICFQKLKMHVRKCSCPKVNVGWNLHVQLCFILSFRQIWYIVWMESFSEFWYFDVLHTFIQKNLWISYFDGICTISKMLSLSTAKLTPYIV